METHGRQRFASKRLTFTGPRTLLAWLESPLGAELRQTIEDRWLPSLAGRLFDGSEESKALQAEVLERAGKETRCIVLVEPYKTNEAQVRVYGPRELKVKVITLPMARFATPEQQRALEQLVEVELPRAYQPYYYPAACRASETIEILTPEAALHRARQIEGDKLVLSALKAVKK
jgi:hypothetical protein